MAFGQESFVLDLLGYSSWTVDAEAKLAAVIASAEAEIDAYLAVAVTLPFTVVPPLVQSITTRYVAYHLYRNADYADSNNPRLTDYKLAREDLSKVTTGKLKVITSEPTERSSKTYIEGEGDEYYDARFTPAKLEHF